MKKFLIVTLIPTFLVAALNVPIKLKVHQVNALACSNSAPTCNGTGCPNGKPCGIWGLNKCGCGPQPKPSPKPKKMSVDDVEENTEAGDEGGNTGPGVEQF